MRVRDQALHDRDALDQFGDSLREQRNEAERDQEARRPCRQPSGARRLFPEGRNDLEETVEQIKVDQDQHATDGRDGDEFALLSGRPAQ